MMNPKIRFKKSDGSDYQNYTEKCIGNFLTSYTNKNNSELHPVVAVGRYGIRKREDIYSKDLSEDISKNRVIDKNTMIIGMGSKQIDLGFLFEDTKYSVSPAYSTFHIHDIEPHYFKLLMNHKNTQLSNQYMIVGARQGKSVDKDGLLAHDLDIPVDIEEQTKIANFLSEIDNLIASAEHEVESTKQLKKAMLQKMFPKKGEKFPEIRFPEFTDAWEQRKLGDVFVEYSEKGHDELPPLTIIQGKGTILREESERNLIYDKSGLKNYKLVNQDDFILHLRSFEGGLEKANSRGIVSPAYHIFHGENADTKFYYPFFRSKYFISVLLKPHVYGIRDGKSIDVDGMKTIDIPYPTIEEQNKIGDYFACLDSLITLHQRKLDAYKKFKKAMMQKMFV